MNTKINRFNVITLTLTSLLGFGAAMAAADAAASNGPDVTVSYRDLDLSRPADVRTLYRRSSVSTRALAGRVDRCVPPHDVAAAKARCTREHAARPRARS